MTKTLDRYSEVGSVPVNCFCLNEKADIGEMV